MGPYPQYLKERIASKTGHMSNSDTAEFLAENITEHLRYIWLCHLSKDNNHPELAYKTVEWKLKNKGVIVGKDVQLLALKRNTPSELYVFELWIGTRMGLYQLDKKSGVYQYIDLPIESLYICALYQRGNGILYIGTLGTFILSGILKIESHSCQPDTDE